MWVLFSLPLTTWCLSIKSIIVCLFLYQWCSLATWQHDKIQFSGHDWQSTWIPTSPPHFDRFAFQGTSSFTLELCPFILISPLWIRCWYGCHNHQFYTPVNLHQAIDLFLWIGAVMSNTMQITAIAKLINASKTCRFHQDALAVISSSLVTECQLEIKPQTICSL